MLYMLHMCNVLAYSAVFSRQTVGTIFILWVQFSLNCASERPKNHRTKIIFANIKQLSNTVLCGLCGLIMLIILF